IGATVGRRPVQRTEAMPFAVELRLNGVLGSWAAEACRQTHGGRVLESPPNYGYHPTNFRENSNRLWFLRLLPYAPSRRSYPDGHRGGHKCCSRTRAP